MTYDMPGELRPALDGGATVRESGSAPAPGVIRRIRGSFRWDEQSGEVTQISETNPVERDTQIELERAELLKIQRDILERRRR
jgi:hypothetical protein